MSWHRELANKAGHVWGRSNFDSSLDEEARLHMEEKVTELCAQGMTLSEARASARKEFGSMARMAEESREAWRWVWIEDLIQDLRYAARALARDRGFALTAVASLALGIGVNTTIFSLTNELLLSSPSVRDPETLAAIEVGGSSHLPMREFKFIRDSRTFEALAGANEMGEANWRNGDASLRVFASRVTDNFFEVAGTPIGTGRAFAPGERNVAIISHGFWLSNMHADPGVLGRGLILDGQPYTIVGVLPRVHRTLVGFGYAPDVYLPADERIAVGLYARLSPDATEKELFGKLRTVAVELDRVYPDGNHKWAEGLSINKMNRRERMIGKFLPAIPLFFAMLMGVVGLLLLIACANVASLMLARASARTQEFAIRMSIGAGRGRLVRQLLTESLLLSAMGTAVGLALNYALTRILNNLPLSTLFPIQLTIQPDSALLFYSVVTAAFCAILVGLLPALKSTRAEASVMLKRDERQVSGRRATLRNALVVGQLALSVLVLIVAALSIRNLIESTSLDPGFDLKQTLWAQVRMVPEPGATAVKVRAKAKTMVESLRSVAGVESAAVAGFVPLNDHFLNRSSVVYTDLGKAGMRIDHAWNAVSPDYFRTMGIPIVEGREFDWQDREGARRVVIVNETFVKRAFQGHSPLGHTLRFSRDDKVEKVIVGVARNSKYSTIGEQDRPAIYDPYFQVWGARPALQFLLKVKGPPESAQAGINSALLSMDASSSVELKPMNRATAFALLPSRVGAGLLGAIGSLGLVLAAVGLYGVVAYSISRRTREIGLRVALGARRGSVLRLVLREGSWVMALGLTIGVFLAVFVTKPLAMFLVPGLKPSDPITYVTVAIVLLTVGCIASLRPAARALSIDAMAALRHE